MQKRARSTGKMQAKRWLAVAALAALASCSSDDGANGAGPNTAHGQPGAMTTADASAIQSGDASTAFDPSSEDPGKLDANVPDSSGNGDANSTPDGGQTALPKARPIDRGVVSGAISGGNGPNIPMPTSVNAAQHGYVEAEYFLEGTAHSYAAQGEQGPDGAWKAATSGQAGYKTRLLVRRPAFSKDFNGTVLVEWLNVTGSLDVAPAFAFAWEELLRGGYAYVGVSVQKAGVDSLKGADSVRYATLNHPGDAYGYDIFAQAGAAVGWPGRVDVLGGLKVQRLIAYGESQSAMRLITYANAIQPLTHVYDGIMIHSRAGWGAAVGTESDALLGNGKPVRVRSDLDARVLQLFTESELFLALGPAYAARQPDSDRLRTWEIAGAAHADERLLGKGTDIGCGPANPGPQHYVVKAAVRGMHRWIKDGVPPPSGQPLQVNAAGTAIVRNADGNALGGIRTPTIDVPIATLSGEATWNPTCLLFGQTTPFTRERLLQLYPTHQDYVDKVTKSARATREAGFILAEEEAAIVAEATTAPIPQ